MAGEHTTVAAADLDVERLGDGPSLVLVHGSVVGAARTWRHQRALASGWTLVVPNRPGFGESPPLRRGDFEAEAPLMAAFLQDGAHLAGHSYGAIIALYAAALTPASVLSLTVSEPGCLRVAAGDPQVDEQIAHGELLYEHAAELSPRDFLLAFRGGVGSAHPTPDPLPEELLRGIDLLKRERPPWEADPPLATLCEAAFPKLVISGGHSPVFEAVCDAVAQRIGAQRAVIPGRGHTIPATGEPYNSRLRTFLQEAQAVSQENVEVVRAALAASARGDAEGFMSALDPAIEWTPVKKDPHYAVHRGLEDVAVWLAEWSEVFPDMRWEVERIIDAGGPTVVALVRMRGRGGTTGAEVGTLTYGVLFTVRAGKITRIEEADTETALKAAGLEK